MSRYGIEYDPETQARMRQHEVEAERQWAEDRRESERQWRAGEERRRARLRPAAGYWQLEQVSENSWKVYLDGQVIALIVDTGTPKGTAILEFVERGEAIAKYLKPGHVTPQSILEAFQTRALTEGT